MARAWIGFFSSSFKHSLISLCRFRRGWLLNSLLTIMILKWVSLPGGPLWLSLSFMIFRCWWFGYFVFILVVMVCWVFIFSPVVRYFSYHVGSSTEVFG